MSNSISSSRDQAGLVTHRRTVSVHTDLSSLTQRIADESTTPTAHDSPHSSNSSTSVTISTGLPRLKHPAPAPHAVTRVLKRLTLVWQPLLAGALLIAGCLLWLCISLKSEYEAAQREEWSPASWGNPWAGQPGTDGKSGGAHTMSWHQFADHNKAVLRASFAHLVDTALTKPAKAPGGAAGGLPAGPYDGARIHGSRAGASTGPLELQPISQSDSTGIDSQGAGLRHSSHKPVRLKYPVLWAGPFFTRSGYGTEAISYVAGLLEAGLLSREDLWITQAGDNPGPDAVAALDPGLRQMLWEQEYRNVTRRLPPAERDRPLIVICHTFPECWRVPRDDKPRHPLKRVGDAIGDAVKYDLIGLAREVDNGCPCPNKYIKDRVVYVAGRTMFETEKLPEGLVEYANAVDEVLVPTRFNLLSFAASGVHPPGGIHTLAQGINVSLFDPSAHQPLELDSLQGALITGTPRPRRRQLQQEVQVQQQPQHQRQLLVPAAAAGTPQQQPLKQVREGNQQQSDGQATPSALQQKQSLRDAGLQGGLLHRLCRFWSAPIRFWSARASGTALQQGLNRRHLSASNSNTTAVTVAAAQQQQPNVHSQQRSSAGAALGLGAQAPAAAVVGATAPRAARRPFRFLSVFKWEARKGWDILLKSFLEEFQAWEEVELHIVTNLSPVSPKVEDEQAFLRATVQKLMGLKDDQKEELETSLARVYVYTDYIPDAQYPRLYKAMDALVIPTHGEGWGRPQFEAMAMGLPVISTNWSGLTEFMSEAVAYPIHVEAMEESDDPGWFHGQKWARPSLTHLRQLMRHVATDAVDTAAKASAAREYVRAHFSTQVIAKQTLAHLLRIQRRVEYILSLDASQQGSEKDTAAQGYNSRHHQLPRAAGTLNLTSAG